MAIDPAPMLIAAEPPLSVVAAELYPPPLSVTVPVGTGFPLPPLTTTVTDKACVVVMLNEDGVTVTVGVIRDEVSTVTVTMLEVNDG